jgi:predicted ATPase
MREGLAAWEATGARLLRPYYLCLLAEVHATPSMASEGLRLVAEALSVVQSSGERNFEAELNRVHGELLLANPAADASGAELSFRRALAIGRKQQAKALEVRAAMSLGRLWQARGKRASAHRALAEVYGWFSEGFDTGDLTQARAALTSWGAE